jgi:alkanesulfonate monooxygenase SsuD/methylene tetrahydromethanopterin reductase-like flavin-dependent oxidoreductase (luciferase family)
MGGESDAALRRTARLADGWMAGGTLRSPTSRLSGAGGGYPAAVARLREYAQAAGRDPSKIGLERRVNYADPPDQRSQAVAEWQTLGGTHLSINTMRAGLASPRDHVEAIRTMREALRQAAGG